MSNEQQNAREVDRDRERSHSIAEFLSFLQAMRDQRHRGLVAADHPEVQRIRGAIEDRYTDDRGKPAMYQQFESALYDDAQSLVTLWQCFDDYQPQQLRHFQRLTTMELEGLRGDRHPRKVFDRSPFGFAALIVGTITVWMSLWKTYTGDDLSELLELIRFNAVAGTLWIVGLFIVVWFIVKTHRNNGQTAFLSSIARALDLYLDDTKSA